MSLYNLATEVRVTVLRETPATSTLVDTPESAARYWNEVIATDPRYSGDVENFYVLILNTRNRVTGHVLVSVGILNACQAHAREVFRAAIVANAHGIVCMHNHPSGDTTPSDADIRATRDLKKAGDLLKIELLDHVIVGVGHTSLRERGYLY